MTDAQNTYYRTGAGTHRHLDRECANQRRAIHTGDVQVIPAEQVSDWAPCEACCGVAELAAHEASVSVKADTSCTGRQAVYGSYNSRRAQIKGTCATCGRANVGMDRRSMKLAKHQAA